MTTHTLVLLRHGEAEPARSGRSDADRPLSRDGRAEVEVVGAWLAANGLLPELVLCSPARRTVQTWAIVAGSAGSAMTSPTVGHEPRLYTQGVQTLLGLLAGIPEELSTVLIIGHNPAISLASALLSPPFDGQGLPTAGLAVHRSAARWADWATEGAPLVLRKVTQTGIDRMSSPHQDAGPVTP
jgi:phosphohistidine phosphatase